MKQLYYKILENIGSLFAGLLLIALPALYFRKVLDPVLYPRYLALSIWVVLMIVIIGYKVWKGKFQFKFGFEHKVIFGTLAIFVLLNAISSFNVINSAEAIFKTAKEFTFFLTLLFFFQLFRNNEKSRDIVIKSMVISTLGFLAIGTYQLIDADFAQFIAATSDYGYWFRQAVTHVKSTLASINPFASFLFLSLAFSVYGSIVFKKIWRMLSIIAVLGALVFIFILASKASWGALGLALAVGFLLIVLYLFYIAPKKHGNKVGFWGQYAVLLLPFVLFIVGFYAVEKTEIGAVKMVVDKVKQVLDPEESLNAMYNSDNPSSAQTRTLVWANTIQMARDNPLLGVGPGQWRITYAKYGVDPFEWDIRNGAKHFQRTHNDFIWILGELGYTGLLVFLLFYIGGLGIAYRNFANSSDKKTRLINGIVFSVLIGFMINMFVSFPRERITHNITYLLLFALILSTTKGVKKDIIVPKTFVLVGLLISLIIAGFNVNVAKDMVKGDKGAMLLKYASIYNKIPIMARGVRNIGEDTYYTLDPFASPIPYYNATVLHTQKKLNEAKNEFLKAYDLHPYHLKTLVNLGTAYNMTGDADNAIKYYDKALEISPRFEEALMNRAIISYNQNKSVEALEYIRKVPISSKNPPKFKLNYITICRKRAAELVDQLDIEKLTVWYKDENKINTTFVTFQGRNESFDKILLQEIGK